MLSDPGGYAWRSGQGPRDAGLPFVPAKERAVVFSV